jgi:transcriptional antiterminator RfaH
VAYWAVARLMPRKEALALHCLEFGGFRTYFPRLRETHTSRGRKIVTTPALFPGYTFLHIDLQWHAARWSLGVMGLIMDGDTPGRVPDAVIAELRSRERGGYVRLPTVNELCRGASVRVKRGLFAGQLAIFQGVKPRERVEILLSLLGRVLLAKDDIEPA